MVAALGAFFLESSMAEQPYTTGTSIEAERIQARADSLYEAV